MYPLRALLRCTEAQKCLSVTPLLATLTHSVSRKSFPCHSYANTRDGDATVAPISASVSLCLSFKPPVSSLQPPASRLKSPGSVGGYALPILPVRSVFLCACPTSGRRASACPETWSGWQVPFFLQPPVSFPLRQYTGAIAPKHSFREYHQGANQGRCRCRWQPGG